MADVLYSTIVSDVQPFVLECPQPLIVKAIRETVIELCKTAEIYKYTPAEISIVIAQYSYTPVIPTGTRIIKYGLVYVGGTQIGFSPWERVLATDLKFNSVSAQVGTPSVHTYRNLNTLNLHPTPNAVLTLGIVTDVILAPTETSTGVDQVIVDEYRETIVDGAVRRLTAIPKKTWTDPQMSVLRGNLFRRGVSDAYHRAHTSNGAVTQTVQLRKFR